MNLWTSSAAAVVWWHSRSRLSAPRVRNSQSSALSVSLKSQFQFCIQTNAFFFFVLTGARLNCDSCGKFAVPAYHLAMSDTSIRNFCTLPCVMAFQVTRFAVVAFVPLYHSWKCDSRCFGATGEVQKQQETRALFYQAAHRIQPEPRRRIRRVSAKGDEGHQVNQLCPVQPQHRHKTWTHPYWGSVRNCFSVFHN